jgi:3-keto-5-aminohexanoate cleavage enzyme
MTMDDLIITVAADSHHSYPSNPLPADHTRLGLVDEYVAAVDAGAAVCHLHGAATFDPASASPRPDPGAWTDFTEAIRSRAPGVVIQNGLAGMTVESKRLLAEAQRPDMMSTMCGPHDTRFARDADVGEPIDLYAAGTQAQLEGLCTDPVIARIKLELECFTCGSYWIMQRLIDRRLLPGPRFATLFLGWEGGTWTPPTLEALLFMVRHLPSDTNWNLSVMDPATAWQLIPAAIALGGHVRVGWEDNPYLPDGRRARSNAELVETVVALADAMGRTIASPDAARRIIGISATV